MQQVLLHAIHVAEQGSIASDADNAVSVVAALVAWPVVAVVSAGDGVAMLCEPGSAANLFVAQTTHTELVSRLGATPATGPSVADDVPAGLGYSPAVEPNSWNGVLDDSTALILGTSATRLGALGEPESLPALCGRHRSSSELVDALLETVSDHSASVGVARLAAGAAPLAEQVEAVAQHPKDGQSASEDEESNYAQL